MAEREYLVEMDVRTDSAGTIETLCYSVFGFNTEPWDSRPNQHFAPRLIRPGVLSMNLYAPNATAGASRVGFGGVELANPDGALDAMIDYGFAGGEIRLKGATRGTRYDDFTTLLTGVMDQPTFSWTRMSVAVRDRQSEFATQPLQESLYAGTNSGSPLAGAEGTASDIKGKAKPLVYGKVFNAQAVCVNTELNIYQVHDGSLASVDAVYVGGAAKSAGSNYADYATMESTAPTAGQYRALPSAGLFRIDAATSAIVTADATQGATTTVRTAGQIMKQIAERAGLLAAEISDDDVTTLDAACSQIIGVFAPSGASTTLAQAMDRAAAAIGAWWTFDLLGVLRVGRLVLPAGDPVAELDATNVLSVQRERTMNQGRGIPAWRVRVRYQQNETKQTDGLASTVTPARAAYLNSDGLTVSAEDATVRTQYPLAVEMGFTSSLTTEGDAATEAARLLTIYKTRRDLLTVATRFDLTLASALQLGAVVRLTLPRFGLDAGKLFLVIGYVARYERDVLELTLWG